MERVRRERWKKEQCSSKGVEMEEGRLKEAVEKLWLEIEVERGIKEVKEIRRKTGKEKKMVLVRLKDRVRKREVMQRKNVFKRRMERIEDDMTLKKRKMQWSLERIAEKKRRNKRRVWVKYGKI